MWKSLSPSICYSAIFTVQIMFFFLFCSVDAQTHTWAHINDGIEKKKEVKTEKLVAIVPLFYAFGIGEL